LNVGIVGLGKMGILHTAILNTIDDVKITSIAEKESILAKHIKKGLPTLRTKWIVFCGNSQL